MCLRIDSCFGKPPVDDDRFPSPADKHGAAPPALASRTQQPAQRNGGHHNSNTNGNSNANGNGYPARTAAAGAEAGRKASNDVRSGPVHAGAAAAPRGWHAATGAQEKAAARPYAGADDGTLKQQQQPAASNGRAAAAEGHGARGGAPQHSYYERAQPPAAHREDAADSYYRAAAATADRERY